MDLTWEDPTPSVAEEDRALRAQLMQHPGAWARVETGVTYINARATADRLRRKGMSVSRRVQADGTYHLYVRWPET